MPEPNDNNDKNDNSDDSPHKPWSKADVEAYMLPYVRRSPPWSAYEVVKTAFCTVFLLPMRFIFLVLIGVLVWFFAWCAMVGVPHDEESEAEFIHKPLNSTRNMFIKAMYPLIRAIAFVSFGLVNIDSQMPDAENTSNSSGGEMAYVVIANHLGYLDILVLLCHFRASFVSKGFFKTFPFIGTIARAIQTLFVRDGKSLTASLIARVRTTHECHMKMETPCPGCPGCLNRLVIFSEGTTTNGYGMVNFRTGVFNAGIPVLPVTVEFPHKHWNMSWETVRFRTHLFRTMTQFVNKVRIKTLPVYVPNEEEKSNSQLYARNVQLEMAKYLEHQEIYSLNRKHKFLYHRFVCGKIDAEEVGIEARKLVEEDKLLLAFAADNERRNRAVKNPPNDEQLPV